ncbi:MAG TPA: cyclase family protein [Gammaproteobacteria bacterium]|nr:cyclase family protein [Gammaproteobacteria bacterium]
MTILEFELDGRRYRADTAAARSLAIRLEFGGPQPGFFGAPPALAEVFSTGGFVGDTRAGGSCNVGVYRLNPHCNGTHTECAGHIADDTITLADLSLPALMPATLVSIHSDANAITREDLEEALRQWTAPHFHQALIIRTLPNAADKQSKRYDPQTPPLFLNASTMHLVREMGVEHLLVDLPSLDAMDDDKLTAHRIFWADHHQATVTEMIYAPDEIADGYYVLNLQLPAFATDAAPSRPLIFPIEPE